MYHYPILIDFGEQAGSAAGHYFHQDLLVASFIYDRSPVRHIDIGSRVDGFVAHVAAFRVIEVMDVRELRDTGHKNICFTRVDLMNEDLGLHETTDSLSCLHAIEHFGLGRYGDSIDPNGHIKGFNNLLKMVKADGFFYISFPIGRQSEVHFNAHRVFHPKDVLSWPKDTSSVRLERFDYVDDFGELHQNVNLDEVVGEVSHGCGIYSFRKLY